MLVRGLKGLSLHRPMKVERTRKRSEGFPPDRKVEKKKGEGPAVTVAATVLQPKVAEVGRGAGCFCHRAVVRPLAKSGLGSLGPGSAFSPGRRAFRGGEASETAQRDQVRPKSR